MEKVLFFICICVLLFLHPVLTTPVIAFGNIHFGSIEIHPFFNVKEGSISNIYLAEKGEEKSSGYRAFIQGVRCDWLKTRFNLQLNYLYEYINYDHKDIRDKNFYDLDSKYSLNFGKSGYNFGMDGRYRSRTTIDPATSEEQAERRRQNDLNLDFRLNLMGHFGIYISPHFTNHRYDEADMALEKDRDIMGVSVKASIRPFTKTNILLEYGYTKSEYIYINETRNQDSKANSILTGLEWEATEKLKGAIKGGYQWKEYLAKELNRTGERSPQTWRVEVDLTYQFSEFTALQFSLERKITDTTYKNSGFYYENKIEFGFDHKLTYKIRTWLDIIYEYTDYQQALRKDEIWEYDLGLSYKFMEWITGDISYHTRIRESNEFYDYTSNQFELGLHLLF